MPRRQSFWQGFAQTFDPQPAANLIASQLIKKKQAQDEAEKEFYAEQQKRLDEARQTKQRLDALTRLAEGTKDVTSFGLTPQNKDLQTNYDFSIDSLNPKTNIAPQKMTQPLMKAQTETLPLTKGEKVKYALDAGLSNEYILKMLQTKGKSYSQHKSLPYQELGLNKDTNQWEVINSYDKNKGEINPAYSLKYQQAELNLIPKIKWNNGQAFYTTDIGLYDPIADRWQTDEDGQKHILKTTETKVTTKGINGEDLLDKTMKTKLGNFYTTQQNLMSQLDIAHKNPNGIVVDPNSGKPLTIKVLVYTDTGEPVIGNPEESPDNKYRATETRSMPITENMLKDRLTALNQQYRSFAKNLASQNLKDWTDYVKVTDDKDYWNKLQDAHIKGWIDPKTKQRKRLSEYDFQIGQELYQSTFGKNPLVQYGITR